MAIGFTFPFTKATGSLGYFQTTNDELSAVTENIKSLLLTNWGERVMHYDMGCNLREFLFNLDDPEIEERIADRIISQFMRWLPFVSVDDIVVGLSENFFNVKVRFSLKGRPNLNSLVTVQIGG